MPRSTFLAAVLPPFASDLAASGLFAAVLLAAFACHAGPARAETAPERLAAGKEKYVQCASCHGADGRSTVIEQYPKIGGQTGAYVVSALKAYRDGRRQGTYAAIMAEVAKPLSDEDIARLAEYVESL